MLCRLPQRLKNCNKMIVYAQCRPQIFCVIMDALNFRPITVLCHPVLQSVTSVPVGSILTTPSIQVVRVQLPVLRLPRISAASELTFGCLVATSCTGYSFHSSGVVTEPSVRLDKLDNERSWIMTPKFLTRFHACMLKPICAVKLMIAHALLRDVRWCQFLISYAQV